MLLAAGHRLGHYEILTPIGAGGMGEVYRARDTLLRRTVAIKVLRAGLAGDARGHLLREARAASALSHPHICTVHSVEEADGFAFIVMEYVSGQPLDGGFAPENWISGTLLKCRRFIKRGRTGFIYSADRNEPAHVHVERDANRAKFWLAPVRLARSGGFGAAELLRIERHVIERESVFLRAWDEHFTTSE